MSRNVRQPQYHTKIRRLIPELPTADPEAAMLIGTVFAQAVVLYASYGALERVVGPRLLQTLTESDDAARN